MSSLATLAYAGRAWPFEQARALIARLVKSRVQDQADQKQALSLIEAGKTDEALKQFEGLDRPVIFETGGAVGNLRDQWGCEEGETVLKQIIRLFMPLEPRRAVLLRTGCLRAANSKSRLRGHGRSRGHFGMTLACH